MVVVGAWKKHHQRQIAHERLQVIKNGMGANNRVHGANAREKDNFG